MAKVSKSVVREIGADEIRAFSSFDDYVTALISEGVVKSSQDLVSRRPDLLGSILFKWYQQGQVACLYARMLAMKPETQWPSITIQGTVDVEQLEGVLKDAAQNQQALQLIFPGPGTAKHAVDLTKSLCEHPSWSCKEIPWFEDEKGRSLQIGLRWHLKGSDYLSWVLGIAPFDPMPFTRRFEGAPFVALVFRPTPPTEFIKPKYESNLQAAHLAHMDDTLGDDQAMRDKFTEQTARAKRALLGSELLSTARAKVTFALPLWCRKELGDTLTQFEEEANA